MPVLAIGKAKLLSAQKGRLNRNVNSYTLFYKDTFCENLNDMNLKACNIKIAVLS